MVYINFEDRGGLMGFELLPIEDGDEDTFDIFSITSPEKWTPHKFVKDTKDYDHYYDPSDLNDLDSDYPASLNHLSLSL